MIKALTVSAALVVSSLTAASAATFDFTTGPNPFSADGVTATASAERKCMGWRAANVSQTSGGLGVASIDGCFSNSDAGALDGQIDERLTLSFSEDIILETLTFTGFEQNIDLFRLFVDSGLGFVEIGDFSINPYNFPLGIIGSRVRILVTDDSSAFRVSSLEFSQVPAVPLPASGLLLIAGLGALGLGRRRSA